MRRAALLPLVLSFPVLQVAAGASSSCTPTSSKTPTSTWTSTPYWTPTPSWRPTFVRCDISGAEIYLPPNQTTLGKPQETASFIAVALGTQNYTCYNGKYNNTGAVAELFDISCFYNSSSFWSIQDVVFAAWESAPSYLTPQEIISLFFSTNSSFVLGQHYFVTNPTGKGIEPKWDFTSQGTNAGNKNAFVVAAANISVPAPRPAYDIPWVKLNAIQGYLAQEVYRVDTRGGLPPSSCTGSSSITVRYAAKYYLFGGSVGNGTGYPWNSGSPHGYGPYAYEDDYGKGYWNGYGNGHGNNWNGHGHSS